MKHTCDQNPALFGQRGSEERRKVQKRFDYLRRRKESDPQEFIEICGKFGTLNIATAKKEHQKSVDSTDNHKEDNLLEIPNNDRELLHSIDYGDYTEEAMDKPPASFKPSTTMSSPTQQRVQQVSSGSQSNSTRHGKNFVTFFPVFEVSLISKSLHFCTKMKLMKNML